jgi:hypothetical protein
MLLLFNYDSNTVVLAAEMRLMKLSSSRTQTHMQALYVYVMPNARCNFSVISNLYTVNPQTKR